MIREAGCLPFNVIMFYFQDERRTFWLRRSVGHTQYENSKVILKNKFNEWNMEHYNVQIISQNESSKLLDKEEMKPSGSPGLSQDG